MKKALPSCEKSEHLFDGFFKVRRDHLSSGVHYDIIEMQGNAVGIIAITAEELFLVNREYRPAIKQEILTTSFGLILPEEDPLEAAHRELKEETGYTSTKWTFLGTAFPFPGITDQTMSYFLAEDVEKTTEQELEQGEWIETELMTYYELKKQILSGQALDGVFLTGLYFLEFN